MPEFKYTKEELSHLGCLGWWTSEDLQTDLYRNSEEYRKRGEKNLAHGLAGAAETCFEIADGLTSGFTRGEHLDW